MDSCREAQVCIACAPTNEKTTQHCNEFFLWKLRVSFFTNPSRNEHHTTLSHRFCDSPLLTIPRHYCTRGHLLCRQFVTHSIIVNIGDPWTLSFLLSLARVWIPNVITEDPIDCAGLLPTSHCDSFRFFARQFLMLVFLLKTDSGCPRDVGVSFHSRFVCPSKQMYGEQQSRTVSWVLSDYTILPWDVWGTR